MKDFDFHIVGKKGKRRVEMLTPRRMDDLTKDHIIPRAFLRTLKRENIRLMSKDKNQKKGSKLTMEGLIKVLRAIDRYKDPDIKLEITIKK